MKLKPIESNHRSQSQQRKGQLRTKSKNKQTVWSTRKHNQDVIGYNFASDWLRRWHRFSGPVLHQCNNKTNLILGYFCHSCHSIHVARSLLYYSSNHAISVNRTRLYIHYICDNSVIYSMKFAMFFFFTFLHSQAFVLSFD